MKLGVIGTGFVFDHYMTTLGRHPGIEIAGIADIDQARADAVCAYYGLNQYPDVETMLADPGVECVANFTSIPAHMEISKQALLAGKHVYSEKPLTTSVEDATELADLAKAQGLRLSSAPSNVLGASIQTLWREIRAGRVGTPRIVYAEFDDNPIYLLEPENWRSRSGAPWPYLHEYEMGCTWEHAGYHLNWMCAIFGPVASVTAFSSVTVPEKGDSAAHPLDPADTPDFTVATLKFASGVVGRLTCSIAVPTDHRMRIFGDKGQVTADTYRDYDCPVYAEGYTERSMKARNMYSVRQSPVLQRLFGVEGRRVPLAPAVHPGASKASFDDGPALSPKTMLKRLRRAQYGQQDKVAGLAELAAAIAEDRPHFPTPEFTVHLTEVTLAIQAAGTDSTTYRCQTSFDPNDFPDAVIPKG